MGLSSPALRLLPMRNVRATGFVRVSVSVLVCVCAGVVPPLPVSAGSVRLLQRVPEPWSSRRKQFGRETVAGVTLEGSRDFAQACGLPKMHTVCISL